MSRGFMQSDQRMGYNERPDYVLVHYKVKLWYRKGCPLDSCVLESRRRTSAHLGINQQV